MQYWVRDWAEGEEEEDGHGEGEGEEEGVERDFFALAHGRTDGRGSASRSVSVRARKKHLAHLLHSGPPSPAAP